MNSLPPKTLSRRSGARKLADRAFTMVEILIVIALMGVILMIGIPTVFQAVRKSPIRQAVSDLQEACRSARMSAIMRGRPMEVVINAQDGTITVRQVVERREETADLQERPLSGVSAVSEPVQPESPAVEQSATFSARLPDSVAFKQLLINLKDHMDMEEARVRFYPNGTCDAFTATLLSEQNEERVIGLELTTARDYLEVIR
jgi:prepilin-type N-terminal cleavage/methylation domain-containing protein